MEKIKKFFKGLWKRILADIVDKEVWINFIMGLTGILFFMALGFFLGAVFAQEAPKDSYSLRDHINGVQSYRAQLQQGAEASLSKTEKHKAWEDGLAQGKEGLSFIAHGFLVFKDDVFERNPKLQDCHNVLKELAAELWKRMDFLVFTCHRSKADQERMVKEGKSKTMNSLHLNAPARAMDIVPRKGVGGDLLWSDLRQLYFMSGMVIGIFDRLKKERGWDFVLRTGSDWDCDGQTFDSRFKDPYHFEIRKEGKYCKG